jgi:hypothetical protein
MGLMIPHVLEEHGESVILLSIQTQKTISSTPVLWK